MVDFSLKRDILKQNSYSKKSKKLLFTTFNCAKSQLIPMQDIKGMSSVILEGLRPVINSMNFL